MTDIVELLERQPRWQKSRRSLSWPGKIRMATAVRASVAKLRDRPWRAPEAGATGRSRRDEKG